MVLNMSKQSNTFKSKKKKSFITYSFKKSNSKTRIFIFFYYITFDKHTKEYIYNKYIDYKA